MCTNFFHHLVPCKWVCTLSARHSYAQQCFLPLSLMWSLYWIYYSVNTWDNLGNSSLVRREYSSENSSPPHVKLVVFLSQSNVVAVFDIIVWFLFAELISHEGSKHRRGVLFQSGLCFLLPISHLYSGSRKAHFLKFCLTVLKLLWCWIP